MLNPLIVIDYLNTEICFVCVRDVSNLYYRYLVSLKTPTMRYLLTLLLITSVFLFSGCTKEEGCTNPDACNFSQSAEEDDGSCHLPGDDCDDGDDSTILDQYINTATNAVICQCVGVDLTLGCMDDTACNYSTSAETDDGSCSFTGDNCDDGNSATINDTWSNTCDCIGIVLILGCMDDTACNYSAIANTDDGSCLFIGDSCDDGIFNTINDTWSNTCVCEGDDLILGCMDDLFLEYDPTANVDDSSCSTLLGCSDSDFVEYSGYSYSLISIGYQCWFSENCRYLPVVSSSSAGSETSPYYYIYGYEGSNVSEAQATDNYETYGVLYNWPAVMTEEICPSGWHIPSDEEFTELTDFLGGVGVAGGKMKEAGYDHWNSPNTGATNSSGWAGLPGGSRYSGGFGSDGNLGNWWSASEAGSYSWHRSLGHTYDDVYRFSLSRDSGFSARCVRD